MKRVENAKTFPFEINDEEVSKKIEDIKETKGSSPSGRDIGHYKTALYIPRLMRIHTTMIRLAVRHNLTPNRWIECTNIMLEKYKGSPKIHRLRIIQILEFGLNLIYKNIWSYKLTKPRKKTELYQMKHMGKDLEEGLYQQS